MSDDYPAANAPWPSVDAYTSSHIVGATLFDETGVLGEFVTNEAGELVPAEPGEGIVGAVLSTRGGRWLRRSEVVEEP